MPSTPYMKLYIGDYLGDTADLTCLEHGAYLLLIMAYWQRKGPLPADDAKLARITRCTNAEWLQCKCSTLAFFEERDGLLYHHRIEKEINGVIEISEKRKGAARKKWSLLDTNACKSNANAEQEHSNGDAKGMLSHIHIPENININNIPKDANAMQMHKHEYGSEKNVLMTDAQYSKLVADLGEPMALACIEELSSAKAIKGYKYKRDDLAIRKWVVRAVKEKGPIEPVQGITRTPDAPKLPICPVCGTTGLRERQSFCPKCGYLLEPDCMADPEAVADYKAEWEAKGKV